jgi:hypothetical protein
MLAGFRPLQYICLGPPLALAMSEIDLSAASRHDGFET